MRRWNWQLCIGFCFFLFKYIFDIFFICYHLHFIKYYVDIRFADAKGSDKSKFLGVKLLISSYIKEDLTGVIISYEI